PRAEGVRGQVWVAPFSLASDDDAEREHALGETRLALAMAATLACPVLIVHLERPGGGDGAPESLASVRRSLDALIREAEAARVALALRSGRSPQARPEALVRRIERDLDGSPIGIALDYGQAHLAGDVADAIETAGEFMTVALLSDNRGRKDERLVPGAGSINWDAAVMTTQKVGFSGPALFDVDALDLDAALRQAAQARERLASLLIAF
ncbi:MAG: TIM barrel protein, partial [Gammaproteobacteria bacterium]|nr:TIM barrel protein [Gammaproteobacteria bacterium]